MKKIIWIPVLILAGMVIAMHGQSQDLSTFSKSPTGLYYKIYKASSDTVTPKLGNFVEFDMVYSGKSHGKDTIFYNTKKGDNAAPVKFFLTRPGFKGDLNEGILMLAKGDSADFLVNADSMIFKTFKMTKRPNGIDSGAFFTFHVKMLNFQTVEAMIFKEEADIRKYVKDNNITEKPNVLGLYIIESVKGTGAKIDSGCQVRMNYKVSLINGKELFSSFDRPEPVKFEYGKKIDTPGFEMALSSLHKGSKAKVIVPSTLAFGKKGSGTIVAPYQSLVYDVEILDVKTKAEAEAEQTDNQKKEQQKADSLKKMEPILLEKYIKDNNVTVKPKPSGLYYVPVAEGTGPKAEAGKTVKVHYTGKLVNGKIFDSSRERNTPFEFVLGQGQVIRGWDEGIGLMKAGGKATLIIPSTLGYGEQDMGVIPPYSTLVFDVELLEVK
jgi:FKBP-type peptidyl-prolyl cis-trans isomerase